MKKVRVCCSRSCYAFGGKEIMQKISEETGLKPGEKNEQYDLDWRGCLGWCSNSPNVEVDDTRILFDSEPNSIMERIEKGSGFDTTSKELDIDEVLKRDGLGDL